MKIISLKFLILNSTITSKKSFVSFFCFLFFACLIVNAQEQQLLSGQVEAGSSNIEKIHIINLNLEKGAVTNEKGEFQIPARLNDSLYISSVQFRNTTLVVSAKMLQDRRLVIKLENAVNELAEVMIDNIQLSGYLANDLGKISIASLEKKYELQENLNTFIEKDRELNPYEKPNLNGGLNLNKIAGAVIDRLSSKSEKVVSYTKRELANRSIAIVGSEFFRKDLDLSDNEICNFVYFCANDTRFKNLVINDNAFVLIEYFQTRIADFKERRGEILNVPGQIPG